LLLDEPDTGLDQEGNELIAALWQEHTRQGGYSLYTTHQLEQALNTGERVVLLSGGRVVYQQETRALELEVLREAYRKAVMR
jgi:ABC-type multidrug transport system ATPase subunit